MADLIFQLGLFKLAGYYLDRVEFIILNITIVVLFILIVLAAILRSVKLINS